ncbi:hypothetical protein GCM10023346_43560 [Arthrobacter gyeryongensis]|uniref:Uncharacterized protein n=1 Tax=Arthrobacter gyeryongensis TaxID=1650592 RepID=A0ABP9SU31_9MICC
MMARVAVFFFDGDQGLWDFQAMMRRALAATIGELRRLRPGTGGDMSVEAFVTDREVVAERLRSRVTNLERVRFEAFRQSLARLRLRDDELAAYLNEFYLQRRFADVMFYNDVLPVLAELRRNHHVGRLSNGNSYPKRLGLKDYSRPPSFHRSTASKNQIAGSSTSLRTCCPGNRGSWSATHWPMTLQEPKPQVGPGSGSAGKAPRARKLSQTLRFEACANFSP